MSKLNVTYDQYSNTEIMEPCFSGNENTLETDMYIYTTLGITDHSQWAKLGLLDATDTHAILYE